MVSDGRGADVPGASRIGDSRDVEWIRSSTHVTRSVTSAIPPIFAAYATVELPGTGFHAGDRDRHDHARALVALLQAHCGPQPWWLGYLDKGHTDVVFHNAPRVPLYAQWPYVLARGGPEEAIRWRADSFDTSLKGALPDLMFPADHAWLVSTLWDDDWTCIGGSASLVHGLLNDPELGPRARRVDPDEDMTPPGHQMY